MQQLAGLKVNQKQGLVIAANSDRSERRGIIWITLGPRSGRQRQIEHSHQFAKMNLSLAAPTILIQQLCTPAAALRDISHQPEMIKKQFTRLLKQVHEHPPVSFQLPNL